MTANIKINLMFLKCTLVQYHIAFKLKNFRYDDTVLPQAVTKTPRISDTIHTSIA